VQAVLLPLASIAFVILCGSIALRERRRGTTGLMFSLPAMKPHFVWLKLAAAFVLGLLFVVVPFLRIMLDNPNAALSLVVGMFFLSAAAVGLGTASGTAKVFVVCALTLFYLCLQMGERVAALDFAGWHGIADASIQAGYGVFAIALLGVGYAVHWWRVLR
jgi:nitrate reductase gamma subunit